MKQGTVRYSEEFMKPDGLKGWFSHEKQYDQDTQDPPFDEVVRTVKNEVKKQSDTFTLTVSNPSKISVGEIQVEKEPEIGVTPESILSSPDLKVLETYQWFIKGKPELERAYIIRHDELTQNK